MTPTQRAREIVADALGLDLEEVPESASIETVEDWDSLQHLGVVTALEQQLEVALSPEQVSDLTSVAAIAVLIGDRR